MGLALSLNLSFGIRFATSIFSPCVGKVFPFRGKNFIAPCSVFITTNPHPLFDAGRLRVRCKEDEERAKLPTIVRFDFEGRFRFRV
jgi:hypothetical protein